MCCVAAALRELFFDFFLSALTAPPLSLVAAAMVVCVSTLAAAATLDACDAVDDSDAPERRAETVNKRPRMLKPINESESSCFVRSPTWHDAQLIDEAFETFHAHFRVRRERTIRRPREPTEFCHQEKQRQRVASKTRKQSSTDA